MNDTSLDINSLRLFIGKYGPKSCTMFELIAESSEFAVDVIAAIIAQIAKIKIVLLVNVVRIGSNGLPPKGMVTLFIFASIPKNNGIPENEVKIIAAKKAEMVAVAFVLAAKKRCAKSCSIKEKNIGINIVGKKL